MQNIEIKAKIADLELARQRAVAAGATFEGSYRQVDTYFHVPNGRLKLREISSGENQLIYYQRPNVARPKTSDYHIHPVADPARLKNMLAGACGVRVVVEKRREVYWFDEVRIHLDRVERLGTFLELEGVVEKGGDRRQTQDKVDRLIRVLEISPGDLVAFSYSDLLGDN